MGNPSPGCATTVLVSCQVRAPECSPCTRRVSKLRPYKVTRKGAGMTTRTISSGQRVTGSTVSSGDSLVVLSGGFVVDPTVSGGGLLEVKGGTASSATIRAAPQLS